MNAKPLDSTLPDELATSFLVHDFLDSLNLGCASH